MGLRKKKSLLDQASDYVDAMKPHVGAAYDTAVDFVHDTAIPALSDARDKAAPVLADARVKAAPVIADARDRAVAGLSDARTKAAPYVAQGAALAADKASSARDLADAKVAQLKGEKPKKSKLKRFVLLAGLAGGVAFVAKKLQGGSSGDNWQSSYTPAPAPAAPAPVPTPSAPQSGVDDVAGSSPDEAIADAVESPQPVSTPDEPAEVVEIQSKAKKD